VTFEPNTADPLVGRVIGGRFEIGRAIGAGAWGTVYEARHVQLQKRVAVKVLKPRAAGDPRVANRFVIEARLASQLDHPHCVRILDFGRDEDLLFLAMEYLEGENLRGLLDRERRVEPLRACRIMLQVASALGAAHAKSILHRDIKPANIVLVEAAGEDGPIRDVVKVCDFGLAKMLDPDAHPLSHGPVSVQGVILGTPAFMSPEQARGEHLDQRTDIFSWGAVMYCLLTGVHPFEPDAGTDLARMHERREPIPVTAFLPGLDPRLESIVMQAIAKDREKRVASARDLRIELERFLGIADELPTEQATAPADTLEPITLPAGPPAQRSPREREARARTRTALLLKRNRVPLAAVGVFVAIAIAAVLWLLVVLVH
jgi:eukaryotic-like serine/threonine-protein kinase